MAQQAVTLLPRSSGGSPTASALEHASTSSTAALASSSSPATHRPADHPLREGAALERTSAVDNTTKNSSSGPKNVSAVSSSPPPKKQQAVETPRPRLEDAAPTASAPSSASSPATHRPANHPLREGAAVDRTFAVDNTAERKNSPSSPNNLSAVSSSPPPKKQQVVETPRPRLVDAAPTAAAPSPATHRPANDPLREGGALEGAAKNLPDGRRLQGGAMGNLAGKMAAESTRDESASSPPRSTPPKTPLENAADDVAPFAVTAPTAAAPSSASPAKPSTPGAAPEAVHPESGANLMAALGSAHQPSDAELLKKVLRAWVATGENEFRDVHLLDICSDDPDQLARTYKPVVSEREKAWYFLSELQSKGSSWKHKGRTVLSAGNWKSEAAAKNVIDPLDGGLLGYSRKFSFLRKLGDGAKVRTGWVSNELNLHRAGAKVEDRALFKMYKSRRRDGGAAAGKNCDGGGETTGPKPADDKAVPGRKRVGAPLPEPAHKTLATPPAASNANPPPPAAFVDRVDPPAPSVHRTTWPHFCPECGFDLRKCRH